MRSRLTLARTPAAAGSGDAASVPLELAGSPEIALRSLSVNGAPLPAAAYARTPKGGLLVHAPLPDGAPFTLELETAIRPQDNTSLEGLYKSSGAARARAAAPLRCQAAAMTPRRARLRLACRAGNFCTQCEAEGFRRITFYLCVAPARGLASAARTCRRALRALTWHRARCVACAAGTART